MREYSAYNPEESKEPLFITQDLYKDLRIIRDWPEDYGSDIIEIEGRRVPLDGHPITVMFNGKKVQMDTSREHFGDIIGEIEVPDNERMSHEEAAAEAELVKYYAALLHKKNQKDLLYKTDEITAQEYKIADEALTGWSQDAKKGLIKKVKVFLIKHIILGKAAPAATKLKNFEKEIGL